MMLRPSANDRSAPEQCRARPRRRQRRRPLPDRRDRRVAGCVWQAVTVSEGGFPQKNVGLAGLYLGFTQLYRELQHHLALTHGIVGPLSVFAQHGLLLTWVVSRKGCDFLQLPASWPTADKSAFLYRAAQVVQDVLLKPGNQWKARQRISRMQRALHRPGLRVPPVGVNRQLPNESR